MSRYYPCNKCGRVFSRHSSLSRHVKTSCISDAELQQRANERDMAKQKQKRINAQKEQLPKQPLELVMENCISFIAGTPPSFK